MGHYTKRVERFGTEDDYNTEYRIVGTDNFYYSTSAIKVNYKFVT
ncbi:hypothetical protein KL86DYS1_30355 [uncultured Dysgonomonas sp.]|uniref:Uncharacterized protein n=1 Tax=uncultured Dysgonomonas sp. TaxID=206096 RepID=A0A212JTH4_9BACT|nr:hypothetical protein KL86DYS1_30355 [uncultured Dysgonomonas sp.]